MSTNSLELSRHYTSFSGVDIKVVIDREVMGTLQALSYAIQREKAPIYVLGRVDPLSFSRGKRGIAGTLISLMLDQHLLMRAPFNLQEFVADNDEIIPRGMDLNSPDTTSDLTQIDGGDPLAPNNQVGNAFGQEWTVARPWYVDQIPPIDAVIVAANEYGQAATMRVYGIEILNEGSGFSIDDITIENQMTYVCRSVLPWQKLGQWDFGSGEFNPHTNSGVA